MSYIDKIVKNDTEYELRDVRVDNLDTDVVLDYGISTLAEAIAAKNAGKTLYAKYNNVLYNCVYSENGVFKFSTVDFMIVNSEFSGRWVQLDNYGWSFGSNELQTKLTAGTNITISDDNVISASGSGSGVDIDNSTIIEDEETGEIKTAVGGGIKYVTLEPTSFDFTFTYSEELGQMVDTEHAVDFWNYLNQLPRDTETSGALFNINVENLEVIIDGETITRDTEDWEVYTHDPEGYIQIVMQGVSSDPEEFDCVYLEVWNPDWHWEGAPKIVSYTSNGHTVSGYSEDCLESTHAQLIKINSVFLPNVSITKDTISPFFSEDYFNTLNDQIKLRHNNTITDPYPGSGEGIGVNIDNTTITLNDDGQLQADTGIPAAPTTDGNYVLKCSIVSGVATYSWEAEQNA